MLVEPSLFSDVIAGIALHNDSNQAAFDRPIRTFPLMFHDFSDTKWPAIRLHICKSETVVEKNALAISK